MAFISLEKGLVSRSCMKVHHLNCGTYCTRGIPFVLEPSQLCTRCLLIETEDGVVVVDSGFSVADLSQDGLAASIPQKVFAKYPKPYEALKNQIESLGFKPTDIRHFVITHLDPDHAGGLNDFPDAQVHLYSHEYYQALNNRGSNPIWSYRLRSVDWAAAKKWNLYETEGDSWNGLKCVRQLKGIKADIAIVPLLGHTPGHAGILVDGKSPIFHVGDLYYNSMEFDSGLNRFAALSKLLAYDNEMRLKNLKRVAEIKNNNPGIEIFSAHDHESWLHRHASERNS